MRNYSGVWCTPTRAQRITLHIPRAQVCYKHKREKLRVINRAVAHIENIIRKNLSFFFSWTILSTIKNQTNQPIHPHAGAPTTTSMNLMMSTVNVHKRTMRRHRRHHVALYSIYIARYICLYVYLVSWWSATTPPSHPHWECSKFTSCCCGVNGQVFKRKKKLWKTYAI